VRYYIFALFVIGSLSLATPVQAEKIISWVDQKGVTHFSDTPPIGQTSVEEVHVQPTNQAQLQPKALSASLINAFAATKQNESSVTRSDVVIKGPPKKALTPAPRPSSRRTNRSYRARVP